MDGWMGWDGMDGWMVVLTPIDILQNKRRGEQWMSPDHCDMRR